MLLLFRYAGSFNSDSPVVVAHEQSVYTVEPGKIHARTFQVLFHEGCVRFLGCVVKKNRVKVWHVFILCITDMFAGNGEADFAVFRGRGGPHSVRCMWKFSCCWYICGLYQNVGFVKEVRNMLCNIQ